jgi:hypothetical protein
MPTPALTSNPLLDSLAGYPHWFVVACVTVAGVVALWVVVKLLKWSLYLLLGLVAVAGVAAAYWLLFR